LGPRDAARVIQSDSDFIVLNETLDEGLRTKRMPHAIALMAAIIVAGAGWLATAEVMLAGALGMVLVGALTMDEAYESIEWRSVFLIAGMLPLGLAMEKTGLAGTLSQAVVQVLGAWGPLAVMAGLLVATTLLTQVMSGQATAVVLAPIAIHAAEAVHANPRAFALAVAYGCSLAFLTPIAHPANVLVMGPGGYRFGDYWHLGLPLSCLAVVVGVPLIALVWPLH